MSMPRCKRATNYRHEGQNLVDERGIVDRAAVLGHESLETDVCSIRYATTFLKTLNDTLLDLCEQGNILCLQRQIVGARSPRRPHRVFLR